MSFTLNAAGQLRTRPRPRPVGEPARQVSPSLPDLPRVPSLATPGADAVLVVLASAAWLLGVMVGHPPAASIPWLAAFDVMLLVVLRLRRAYRFRLRASLLEEAGRVVAAGLTAVTVVLAVRGLVAPSSRPGTDVLGFWAVTTLFLLAGRAGRAVAVRRTLARGGGRPTLIVGAGTVGHLVARRLLESPGVGLRPVGFLDKEPRLPGPNGSDLPVLGASWDLESQVLQLGVEHVVLSFSTAPTSVHLDLLRRCQGMGLEVSVVPRLFEEMTGRLDVEYVGGVPMVRIQPVSPRSWQFGVKHALDRLLAGAALVVLAPIMAAAAVAVRLTSGGPILYRQCRVGLDGRSFDMLKFRTMVGSPETDGEADAGWVSSVTGFDAFPGAVPERVDRTTPVGRVLRRLSVDELPQLFNVVRGDMSLVGPRPERVALVPRFEQSVYRYADRHRVKAGITGWAQVHGLRGETSLRDRIEWDNHYIQNWTPWLDVKILLLTIPAVMRGWLKD